MKNEFLLLSFGTIIIMFVLGLFFYTFILPKEKTITLTTPTLSEETVLSATSSNSNSHSLQVVPSNQWYSSIYYEFPTQPLFALPITYKLTADGIGFSYPKINITEQSITSAYTEDFSIGFETALTKPTISKISDWSIALKQTTKSGSELEYTLAKGIPYTILNVKGEALVIKLANGATVESSKKEPLSKKNIQLDTLLINSHGNSYVVFLNESLSVAVTKDTIHIEQPKTIFIGIMPSADLVESYRTLSKSSITNTEVSFELQNDNVTTTYQISTSDQKNPFITIFPHQNDFLIDRASDFGEFRSIRGPLRLIKTNTFKTAIPLSQLPDAFSKPTKNYSELELQIKKDIDEVMKEKPAGKDYYLGVWFGKVANLLLLADTFQLQNEKKRLLEFVKPLFIQSLSYFTYDKTKTSLIAKNPEFGNEKNNDHHFHYGYYIRTAAVLAKLDPTITEEIKPSIDLMANDIANSDRASSMFPFLRHFDIYEGHSWADGPAHFEDGNNNESSSESLQAWYGVYLWSKITNNKQLETTSQYLFTTELQSVYTYWFDKNDFYKSPYQHKIASIVWGGKIDFATWFSNDTNMKYGIQLLPFTPASIYLANLEKFNEYQEDFLKNGGKPTGEWADLFLTWKSFYAASESMKEKNSIKLIQDGNTKSLMLYFIFKNLEKESS